MLEQYRSSLQPRNDTPAIAINTAPLTLHHDTNDDMVRPTEGQRYIDDVLRTCHPLNINQQLTDTIIEHGIAWQKTADNLETAKTLIKKLQEDIKQYRKEKPRHVKNIKRLVSEKTKGTIHQKYQVYRTLLRRRNLTPAQNETQIRNLIRAADIKMKGAGRTSTDPEHM